MWGKRLSSHQLLILLTLQNPQIQNHLGETGGGGAGVPSVSPLHLQSKIEKVFFFVKSCFFKLNIRIFSKPVWNMLFSQSSCVFFAFSFQNYFFAAAHLFSIRTASLYLYISWSSECPKKLEEIGKNSLSRGNIFWAGENNPNGKYDRFSLGQIFLPVTFLFLLQPIANSRAGRDRSKIRKKRR